MDLVLHLLPDQELHIDSSWRPFTHMHPIYQANELTSLGLDMMKWRALFREPITGWWSSPRNSVYMYLDRR